MTKRVRPDLTLTSDPWPLTWPRAAPASLLSLHLESPLLLTWTLGFLCLSLECVTQLFSSSWSERRCHLLRGDRPVHSAPKLFQLPCPASPQCLLPDAAGADRTKALFIYLFWLKPVRFRFYYFATEQFLERPTHSEASRAAIK